MSRGAPRAIGPLASLVRSQKGDSGGLIGEGGSHPSVHTQTSGDLAAMLRRLNSARAAEAGASQAPQNALGAPLLAAPVTPQGPGTLNEAPVERIEN